MKTLLSTLIGVIALGATLPAFAGPDWQVIEHGRKVKLARMQAEAAAAQAPTPPPASKAPDKAPDAAQTMDQRAQHDKMLKECAAMLKDAQ
jgi:hypothetical protein